MSTCLESRGMSAFALGHLFKDAGMMKTALEDTVYLRSREQISLLPDVRKIIYLSKVMTNHFLQSITKDLGSLNSRFHFYNTTHSSFCCIKESCFFKVPVTSGNSAIVMAYKTVLLLPI